MSDNSLQKVMQWNLIDTTFTGAMENQMCHPKIMSTVRQYKKRYYPERRIKQHRIRLHGTEMCKTANQLGVFVRSRFLPCRELEICTKFIL